MAGEEYNRLKQEADIQSYDMTVLVEELEKTIKGEVSNNKTGKLRGIRYKDIASCAAFAALKRSNSPLFPGKFGAKASKETEAALRHLFIYLENNNVFPDITLPGNGIDSSALSENAKKIMKERINEEIKDAPEIYSCKKENSDNILISYAGVSMDRNLLAEKMSEEEASPEDDECDPDGEDEDAGIPMEEDSGLLKEEKKRKTLETLNRIDLSSVLRLQLAKHVFEKIYLGPLPEESIERRIISCYLERFMGFFDQCGGDNIELTKSFSIDWFFNLPVFPNLVAENAVSTDESLEKMSIGMNLVMKLNGIGMPNDMMPNKPTNKWKYNLSHAATEIPADGSDYYTAVKRKYYGIYEILYFIQNGKTDDKCQMSETSIEERMKEFDIGLAPEKLRNDPEYIKFADGRPFYDVLADVVAGVEIKPGKTEIKEFLSVKKDPAVLIPEDGKKWKPTIAMIRSVFEISGDENPEYPSVPLTFVIETAAAGKNGDYTAFSGRKITYDTGKKKTLVMSVYEGYETKGRNGTCSGDENTCLSEMGKFIDLKNKSFLSLIPTQLNRYNKDALSVKRAELDEILRKVNPEDRETFNIYMDTAFFILSSFSVLHTKMSLRDAVILIFKFFDGEKRRRKTDDDDRRNNLNRTSFTEVPLSPEFIEALGNSMELGLTDTEAGVSAVSQGINRHEMKYKDWNFIRAVGRTFPANVTKDNRFYIFEDCAVLYVTSYISDIGHDSGFGSIRYAEGWIYRKETGTFTFIPPVEDYIEDVKGGSNITIIEKETRLGAVLSMLHDTGVRTVYYMVSPSYKMSTTFDRDDAEGIKSFYYFSLKAMSHLETAFGKRQAPDGTDLPPMRFVPIYVGPFQMKRNASDKGSPVIIDRISYQTYKTFGSPARGRVPLMAVSMNGKAMAGGKAPYRGGSLYEIVKGLYPKDSDTGKVIDLILNRDLDSGRQYSEFITMVLMVNYLNNEKAESSAGDIPAVNRPWNTFKNNVIPASIVYYQIPGLKQDKASAIAVNYSAMFYMLRNITESSSRNIMRKKDEGTE